MKKKARIPLVIAIVVCLFVVLRFFQSPDDGPDSSGYGSTDASSDATCVSQLPPDQRAAAISVWIGGSLPSQVDGTQDCDFYDFAWQSFLALTAPAAQSGGYVFAGWGSSSALFPPSGAVPPPFPSGPAARLIASPVLGKTGASLSALLEPELVGDLVALRQASLDASDISAGDFEQAASLVPYTDANGRWVHYSVLSNQIEYDFVADQGLYASDCYNAWGGSAEGSVAYDPTTGDVTVTCAATSSGSGSSTATHLCTPAATTEASADTTEASADPMPQMPTGAIELKIAWRVLETCDLPDSPSSCTPEDPSPYLTVPGVVAPYSPTVAEQDVTLALIGFHVVTRSAQYPDGIWATFEYNGNAADCPASGPTGPDNMFCTPCPFDFSQWSPELQQVVQKQVAAGDASLDDSGTHLVCSRNPGAFNLATPAFYDPGTGDGQCPDTPIPTEVCRVDPIPDAVAQLNSWVDEVLAASPTDATAALANYELVGVMWLNQDCRAHSECAEQGTLKLTNTTMETFEQALDLSTVNAGTGCLVCHATNQFNPNPFASKPFARGLADRSLLFYRIQQQEAEECTAPPASYDCPACSPDLQARLTVGDVSR